MRGFQNYEIYEEVYIDMIRLIGVVGKIFVLDLASDMEGTISLTGGISKDIDENICTLEELKYIETSFKTKRVSMSSGDYTKLLAALEDKQSGGGTASYPSFTGNADKVLTVNATEDGVEWTTVSSGGTGGGINVIEYDPNLHEQATPVVNTDWSSFENSAVWNSTTGIMGVGTPKRVWSKSYEYGNGATSSCNTQYVALKLDLATLSETRSITIDATLCNDAFGFMFIPKGVSVSTVFEGRWFRSQGGNYPNESFMIFTTAQKVLGEYYFNLYGREYIDNVAYSSFSDSTLNSVETVKPQGIYTVYRENALSYFLRQQGFATEQELIDYFISHGVSEQELIAELNLIKTVDSFSLTTPDIRVAVSNSLFTENTDLYLIMTPYVGTHAASFNLDPKSQIQISYDLVNISHPIPSGVVDGDILHLTEKASILGKIISKDSFIQLYANKTKYIPLSGTVK